MNDAERLEYIKGLLARISELEAENERVRQAAFWFAQNALGAISDWPRFNVMIRRCGRG